MALRDWQTGWQGSLGWNQRSPDGFVLVGQQSEVGCCSLAPSFASHWWRCCAARRIACQPNCRGWVSAVGIVTADSPRDFDEFARGRQLGGATIVLDSSGGSVNDSIALGRRWRNLGALTTVGISAQTNTAQSAPANMAPVAHCESMCVFLFLSGKTRYVPEAAHVRVHQIWIGDRANNAKAATYSADDLMIVERDIGRLARYTFDMGGTGDLLSLSLNVPPWEDLRELSREELRLTNLVTT